MPPREQILDDIAGAVLDGTAVDWAKVESSADDDAWLCVRQLRIVASVAEAHRSVPGACNVAPRRAPYSTSAIPERWGQLRLIERIGRGSFGEVFRAWDTRLDREVALKLLPVGRSSSPHSESAIIHEGRMLARVRHPNVVTIYGAEQIGDRIGLWMEFVSGRTLEQLLKDSKTLGAAEVVRIGVEICRAVSAVHAAGLLHRDIKAHNVMRAEDGRIVLMDFGAGAELDDEASAALAGTPLYLAPEVLVGRPATVLSDIYSLGVLLYHLATDSYPVRGRTVRDVRHAHERRERIGVYSAQPGLRPAALARAIERASDPRPEHRYETVDALMRDLTALQRHPARVRVGYGLAAASAVLLAVLLVSEARARLVADHPSLGSRLASLLAGSPSPIDHPVIVVRPFENLGDPPSDDYVDLITDGLIRQLGKVEGLQVKAQATSFMLRGEPRDLSGIGKRLGVNLVIEGDARFSRERVLVRAALVSVTDGTPLWADEFDRTIGSEADITAAVGELARVIVNRLRLKLGATQLQDETDMATLKMYLRARKLHSERRTVEAVELYKKAIDADPGYAPALAELASAYGDQGTQYPRADGIAIPPREARAHLAPLVERALFINPTLAAAHAAMGFGHALALRWSDAEASFRRAIDLEPTRSTLHGHYVLAVLLPSGKLKEAMDVLEMALLNDPLSLDLRTILARVQLNAGLYDDALENCRRVLEEDPSFPFVAGHAAWARVFRGDRAEALEWFENFYADGLRPGVMGWIHAINGRRAEAEAIAARFNHLPLRQAEIYGLLGQKEKVLEALERQADLNPIRAAFYLTQPELGLRGDPRVEEFRRRRLGFVN